MSMSMKRVLLIAGAPIALAAFAGGSVAFAGTLGGNDSPRGGGYERHSQTDGTDDGSDCPFGHGGGSDDGDSASGLADQT